MIQNLSVRKLQAFAATVGQCFPDSHVAIAGGCLRDLLHDKPVKDIDVFIQLQTVQGWGLALPWSDKLGDRNSGRPLKWKDDSRLVEELHTGVQKLEQVLHCFATNFNEAEDSCQSIIDATNTAGYGYHAFTLVDFPTGLHGHPVQLIFIGEHPVENVKNHFDFGLSQVWCTPNQLRMTPQYWRDHYSNCITYLPSIEPNPQRRLSSKMRAERLKAKYPGWGFRNLGVLDDVVVLPHTPGGTIDVILKQAEHLLSKNYPCSTGFTGKKGW